MNQDQSKEFYTKLATLCKQYDVFIKSGGWTKQRPKDKVIFREYILSIKIHEDDEDELLIE